MEFIFRCTTAFTFLFHLTHWLVSLLLNQSNPHLSATYIFHKFLDSPLSILPSPASHNAYPNTLSLSTFGSNITFKTNLDFTHTSFEVVQASITLQHNTLHFFCLYRPPPSRRNNLTDYVYWAAAWHSWLHKQPPRICLSCWWYEYTLWQSITITNHTDFDYS